MLLLLLLRLRTSVVIRDDRFAVVIALVTRSSCGSGIGIGGRLVLMVMAVAARVSGAPSRRKQLLRHGNFGTIVVVVIVIVATATTAKKRPGRRLERHGAGVDTGGVDRRP